MELAEEASDFRAAKGFCKELGLIHTVTSPNVPEDNSVLLGIETEPVCVGRQVALNVLTSLKPSKDVELAGGVL